MIFPPDQDSSIRAMITVAFGPFWMAPLILISPPITTIAFFGIAPWRSSLSILRLHVKIV
jgi:hypothetical protein